MQLKVAAMAIGLLGLLLTSNAGEASSPDLFNAPHRITRSASTAPPVEIAAATPVCCKRRVRCDGGRRICPGYFIRNEGYCLKGDEGREDMSVCKKVFR